MHSIDKAFAIDSEFEKSKKKIEEENNNSSKKAKNVYISSIVILIILSLIIMFFVSWGLNALFELLFGGLYHTVYIGSGLTGMCYHSSNCPTIKGHSIKISMSDALSRGYRACMVCNPGPSILHVIISLALVLFIFIITYVKIISPKYTKITACIRQNYETKIKEETNKYKELVLPLLSENEILNFCNFPEDTFINNFMPDSSDGKYWVYYTKNTFVFHSNYHCSMGSARKMHVSDLPSLAKPCKKCKPIIPEYNKENYKRIKNLYQKYNSIDAK